LRGAAEDLVGLARTTVSTYSVKMVPGTYDLFYAGPSGATVVPRNSNARLRTGVVVAPTGTTMLDIDLPSVTVSGAITIAGATVTSPNEYGSLWLTGAAGDRVSLGETNVSPYSVTVVPGAYDVQYSYATGSTVAPWNTSAKLRCFDVAR